MGMFELTPENAWLFRITHIENVPWILANGLHCCNSNCCDPNFRNIGNTELIGKRAPKPVSIPPGGVLSDYIPFYFTPHSPMLLNIKSGRNGVTRRPMSEIAVLVTSLSKVIEEDVQFVFSDRHAVILNPQFSNDPQDLARIDWPLLRRRDFKRDDSDPDKLLRYQAEALIYQHLPISALLEIVCYGAAQQNNLQEGASSLGVQTPIVARPGCYFQ
jgi:hypothetical protein